jgi:hypothetical protein
MAPTDRRTPWPDSISAWAPRNAQPVAADQVVSQPAEPRQLIGRPKSQYALTSQFPI